MTYSPDSRTRLLDRLRDLFPDALEFTFSSRSVQVTFPEAAFHELPNGLCTPGAELAHTLTTLGWAPDSADGDPVDDDFPTITFNPPLPDSPVRLHELWQVATDAFEATPADERALEVALR